ncbi:MAG: CtsR family transcriptional regulator [Syntrophomonadaceae bacterium]|nr:CtsR family transcriptional regulator [Syntrophomonadaceae bacterium]
MSSLVDRIERYLKELLDKNPKGVIELQRNELAGLFECAPSQINYVLSTRFSLHRGYIVESRRGGGGFIKLIKLPLLSLDVVCRLLLEELGGEVSQQVGEGLIDRLYEDGLLTAREASLLRKLIHRDTLQLELPERDYLRARILRVALLEVIKDEIPWNKD